MLFVLISSLQFCKMLYLHLKYRLFITYRHCGSSTGQQKKKEKKRKKKKGSELCSSSKRCTFLFWKDHSPQQHKREKCQEGEAAATAALMRMAMMKDSMARTVGGQKRPSRQQSSHSSTQTGRGVLRIFGAASASEGQTTPEQHASQCLQLRWHSMKPT